MMQNFVLIQIIHKYISVTEMLFTFLYINSNKYLVNRNFHFVNRTLSLIVGGNHGDIWSAACGILCQWLHIGGSINNQRNFHDGGDENWIAWIVSFPVHPVPVLSKEKGKLLHDLYVYHFVLQ